jgi:hypothetical protein
MTAPNARAILEARWMNLHDHDRSGQDSRAASCGRHTLLDVLDDRRSQIEHRGRTAQIDAGIDGGPNAFEDFVDCPVGSRDDFSHRITPAF